MIILRVVITSMLLTVSASALQAGMCPCSFGKKGDSAVFRGEIGLNAFGLTELLFNFNSPGGVYQKRIPAGVQAKYHLDKFSIRLSGDLIRGNYNITRNINETPYYSNHSGENRGWEIRAGAGKSLFDGTLRMHFGADVVFRSEFNSGISEGYGDLTGPFRYSYEFSAFAGGLSPFIGVSWRFHKRLSLHAECSANLLFYQTSESIGPYRNETGSTLLLHPMRLVSLNYHFMK